MNKIPVATWITAGVLVAGIIATWAVNNYRIDQITSAIDGKVDTVIYDLAVADFGHRMDTVEARIEKQGEEFDDFKLEITAKETADSLKIDFLESR